MDGIHEMGVRIPLPKLKGLDVMEIGTGIMWAGLLIGAGIMIAGMWIGVGIESGIRSLGRIR